MNFHVKLVLTELLSQNNSPLPASQFSRRNNSGADFVALDSLDEESEAMEFSLSRPLPSNCYGTVTTTTSRSQLNDSAYERPQTSVATSEPLTSPALVLSHPRGVRPFSIPAPCQPDTLLSPVEQTRWDHSRNSFWQRNHPINTSGGVRSSSAATLRGDPIMRPPSSGLLDSNRTTGSPMDRNFSSHVNVTQQYSQNQLQSHVRPESQGDAALVRAPPASFLSDPIHHRSESTVTRRNADLSDDQPVDSSRHFPTLASRTPDRRLRHENIIHGSRNLDPDFRARGPASILATSSLHTAGVVPSSSSTAWSAETNRTPELYAISHQPQIYRPHEDSAQGWGDAAYNDSRSPIIPRSVHSLDDNHLSLNSHSHPYSRIQQRQLSFALILMAFLTYFGSIKDVWRSHANRNCCIRLCTHHAGR
jgi:hypothetical protein